VGGIAVDDGSGVGIAVGGSGAGVGNAGEGAVGSGVLLSGATGGGVELAAGAAVGVAATVEVGGGVDVALGCADGAVAVATVCSSAADVELPPPRVAMTIVIATTAPTVEAKTSSKMRERPIRLLYRLWMIPSGHWRYAAVARPVSWRAS
jgi:hypothetical protein